MKPLAWYVEAARSQIGSIRPDDADDAEYWDGLTAAGEALAESGEPDEDMAMHWIDRYAAGIDETCQLDRVIDALTPSRAGGGEVGEDLSESDKDVAVAQAVEFAEYVERQAKGEMVTAARKFLSLPYAQEIKARLARYQWLREYAEHIKGDQGRFDWVWEIPGHGSADPSLDFAIDAALQGIES